MTQVSANLHGYFPGNIVEGVKVNKILRQWNENHELKLKFSPRFYSDSEHRELEIKMVELECEV